MHIYTHLLICLSIYLLSVSDDIRELAFLLSYIVPRELIS